MSFYPGFDIQPANQPMGFKYGANVFGPDVQNRTLDSIRKSLRDSQREESDPVYSIAMDVVKLVHRRLAWFPDVALLGEIQWQKNPNYADCELIVKSPEIYTQLGIETGKSIYEQFEENTENFLFVPQPQLVKEVWENFVL